MPFRFSSVLVAIFLLAAPLQSAVAAPSPSQVVASLNTVLLDVMRNAKDLGYRGRYGRLAPILKEIFQFPVMARVAVGKHWRALSEDQRARLIEAFGNMSIGTFAKRFDGYSGERFDIVGETQGPRNTILVRNKLTKSNGEAVEINYLLKSYDGRWRAIDVFLDSKYSEMAVKRSEYTSVIANEGFDGLIQRIDKKLAAWADKG